MILRAPDKAAARREVISYAAYRLLYWRFENSPGSVETLALLDLKMAELGFDRNFTSTADESPAALGNRIAQTLIEFGLNDHANEQGADANTHYSPINPTLLPAFPGNPNIVHPNRWHSSFSLTRLAVQSLEGHLTFSARNGGAVKPFALNPATATVNPRDGFDYLVYHDPGSPPHIGGVGDAEYRTGFEQVVLWSGLLDPGDGQMIDISPTARGDNTLGTNDGNGHDLNPVTGLPYASQVVPAGDYYRVLAEFWADGPDSETLSGHWFTIANYVSDHPMVEKRLGGDGPLLDDLEWDVKVHLAMAGAMHDSAITAWGY